MTDHILSRGAPLRDPLMRDELHASIRALHRQGLTDRQIATHIGCSDKTIIRFRHREGLKANSRGGSPTHRKNRGY